MPAYTAAEFLNDKEALEKEQRQLDRAQGRMDAALRRLQEDFNCNDEALAQKLLLKKQKVLALLEKEREKLHQDYTEGFGDKLDD